MVISASYEKNRILDPPYLSIKNWMQKFWIFALCWIPVNLENIKFCDWHWPEKKKEEEEEENINAKIVITYSNAPLY